ncbi:MAG: cyclic pyranopterin monophosphate synthase MoaC [Firmicutes bacterium]|nr:cyclic pyranopterin monophosphate synthase MoaC [Bacillota bacterium]
MPEKKITETRRTFFNAHGLARLVDVSAKQPTMRMAIARGWVQMTETTLRLIENKEIKKGDVLAVAQVAAIMAAKRTSEIIPMCHQLLLSGVEISFRLDYEKSRVEIEAGARTSGQTGVEIEALTAVAIAGLTIYDMCKSADRSMIIGDVRLIMKSGGKSGMFARVGEEEWEK